MSQKIKITPEELVTLKKGDLLLCGPMFEGMDKAANMELVFDGVISSGFVDSYMFIGYYQSVYLGKLTLSMDKKSDTVTAGGFYG